MYREKKSTIYFTSFLMNYSNWLTGFIERMTWIWNIRMTLTTLACRSNNNNKNNNWNTLKKKKTNKTTACKKYTNYKTHTSLKIIKRCAVLFLLDSYGLRDGCIYKQHNFFAWISDFYLHMIIYVKI